MSHVNVTKTQLSPLVGQSGVKCFTFPCFRHWDLVLWTFSEQCLVLVSGFVGLLQLVMCLDMFWVNAFYAVFQFQVWRIKKLFKDHRQLFIFNALLRIKALHWFFKLGDFHYSRVVLWVFFRESNRMFLFQLLNINVLNSGFIYIYI